MVSPDDAGIPEVDAARARAMVEQGALLLDVREHDEWDAGHAPQAVHAPLRTLSLDHVDGAEQVVVVCRSGRRSAAATAALREHGVDAHNLAGGMPAWRDAGAPLTTDTGRPPAII